MTCCANPAVADLQQASEQSRRMALANELAGSAKPLADGFTAIIFSVPDIHCGNCITTIEQALEKMPGVKQARANLTLRRVAVTLDEALVPAIDVADALNALGYPAYALSHEEAAQGDGQLKSLLRALAVSGFASANIMLLSISVWNGADGATRGVFHLVSALIAVPAVAIGGAPFFRSAIGALRHRRTNMDVPISLGVLLATGMSLYESLTGGSHAYFDAAVSLLFFLLIGRTLDYVMRSKARAAAEGLAKLAAKGGFVVGADGGLVYLPLANLKPGMIIRVAAGERFPVDGTIHEGQSEGDFSLVTGESVPVPLKHGSAVEAGVLNLTGPLDMEATRAADQSFLAEVTALMAAAEKSRNNYERVADRMARIYAPAVHVLALVTFLGWMALTRGDFHQSISVAISVLIITCPCALGLAVPVAHVVAAGRLFAAGILMKDGSSLERLSNITEVVFDKTGTLTTGTPTIAVSTIPAGKQAEIAKALALRSMHSGARALAAFLDAIPMNDLQSLYEVPGFGVAGLWHGKAVRLGRKTWVAEIALSNAQVQDSGGLAFAMAGGQLYTATLSEVLRPHAASTLQHLQARGLHTSILSGDSEQAVAAVAKQLAISDFDAALRPGDKLQRLEQLAKRGERVLRWVTG